MSKLFDGLMRARGEFPELDLKALVQTQPGPGSDAGVETAGEAELPTSLRAEVEDNPMRVKTNPRQASNPGSREVSLQLPHTSPALPFGNSHGGAEEQYRVIRTKVLQHPKRPKTIVVSSAGAGDGKSVTAINLAGALALKSESRVVLVDGDLRRPSIFRHLRIDETPGFADVLAGKCTFEEAAINIREIPGLSIIPAGKAVTNPAELLDSAHCVEVFAALRNSFKYLIVDSPPIAAVADYDLLQSFADGVVVVVRPDHTNRTLLTQGLERIPKDKLIGVVMNCVPSWFLTRSSGYGYGYEQYRAH
jgi:capsular exopolysaccharide synthesis family protein